MPRPNLYQSCTTSVITETGETFEIQIRTEEMHKMCEEGIAAHWKYKDGPVSAKTSSGWPGSGRWWSGSATFPIQ